MDHIAILKQEMEHKRVQLKSVLGPNNAKAIEEYIEIVVTYHLRQKDYSSIPSGWRLGQ